MSKPSRFGIRAYFLIVVSFTLGLMAADLSGKIGKADADREFVTIVSQTLAQSE